MAYWTHTKDPVGVFVEKDVGNLFEYSYNDDPIMVEWPHKIFVGGLTNDQGYRYGLVKKTVAYVVVDENDYGEPVVEKWSLKKNTPYRAGVV